MANPNPIPPNPASSPIPGTPSVQGEKPGLPEDPSQKPFTLAPEPGKQGQTTVSSDKPSPFDLAREGTKGQRWSQDQMEDNMKRLQQQLSDAKAKLQDPNLTKNFTQDHNTALVRNVDKMSPDIKTIAKYTGQGDLNPVKQVPGQGVLDFVTKWIGQSQDTMANSVNYINQMSEKGSPDIGGYMKLQFAMNRAQERAELFSSIISASTSGIKQILSTQLG